ncbi:MAG TPA: glycosyltransferase family 4 protein [Coleofasciculaceae cyanobacterium]
MKLSFVNQPWTIAALPRGSDSTGIWSYQVSRYLSKYGQIIYYGCEAKLNANKQSEHNLKTDFPLEYRAISIKPDDIWLKIPRKIASLLNFQAKLPYFGSAWFYLGYVWQIAQDAARCKCDIIHIHNFSQFVPIIRDRNRDAKIIIHLHCEWLNRLDRDAIASRLKEVDLIISCSDYITNKIKTRLPEYAGICRTVNNGVNADYFVPSVNSRPQHEPNAPQLLFVGRISPEKGVHDLIDAFIKITEQYPQAVLTIAGPHLVIVQELLCDLQPEPEVQALKPFYSIDYLEHLKSKIPPHLASQVIFTGSLAQPELLPYYQNADVLINPSLSEAFGMTLVEAMATQTPVIATKIGGMPEIVDDRVNGLLVEPANPQALADAAVELIADPDRAREMGKAGRKKVLQRYCWSQIAESLVDCYADIGVKLKSNVSQKAVARSLS